MGITVNLRRFFWLGFDSDCFFSEATSGSKRRRYKMLKKKKSNKNNMLYLEQYQYFQSVSRNIPYYSSKFPPNGTKQV